MSWGAFLGAPPGRPQLLALPPGGHSQRLPPPPSQEARVGRAWACCGSGPRAEPETRVARAQGGLEERKCPGPWVAQ